MIDKRSRYRYGRMLRKEEVEVGKDECGREGRQKGRRIVER
jgi:hypothetical protein